MKKTISFLVLALSSFAFMQEDTQSPPNYETYAGGHIATIYILPVLGGHVGAKNVFAENFGARLDVETPLPYVVVGVFGLGFKRHVPSRY